MKRGGRDPAAQRWAAARAEASEAPAPARGSAHFGQRLRQARSRADLSLAALGGLCGMAAQQIARLEDDAANPTIRTVESIAAALGLDPGRLAFGPEADETGEPSSD